MFTNVNANVLIVNKQRIEQGTNKSLQMSEWHNVLAGVNATSGAYTSTH